MAIAIPPRPRAAAPVASPGVDEGPRPVADRGDRLVLAAELADEVDRLLAEPELVGIRDASRKHERIEIGRARVAHVELDGEFLARREMPHALDRLALSLGRDEGHFRPVRLEERARLRVFDLLDAVRHQYGDPLSIELGTAAFDCHDVKPPLFTIRP
jgi:hypothetical protein